MMKYILSVLLFLICYSTQAQFPTTDSLRAYNNKYINNSPINSFSSLRMNTLLYGIINHIDSARLGTSGAVGVDTLYTINDSTIRYKKNGVFYNFQLPSYARIVDDTTLIVNGDTVNVGGTGGGGSTVSAAAPIEKDVEDTIRLTYNTEGLRIKDDALDAKAKVFNSEASLRALTQADTNSVYRVRINRDYGEFKYDPDDASSADDSAMVLVDASGNRFKRVVADVIYPEDFGAKGDGVTDDAAAFNKMYRWVEANANNLKEIRHKNKTYLFGSTVYLPGNLPTAGKLLKFSIIGNGAIYKTTAAITILERWPTSQTQALEEYINDYTLELKGINFEGTSTTGQVGARLGAMYTPVLEGCHFTNLDTGVVAAFWLNGRIKNNFFTLNKSVAFKGSSGLDYWTGGSTSNSAFNINEFTGNRVFNGNGSYAGLYFFAADGLLVRDHISEGFNPRYDIFNESQAATVVNGNTYRNIWFESIGGTNGAKNTCFFLRNNGTTVIDGLQNDYADTLVEFSNPVAASEFIFSNIQYYNVTGKLLNAGGSTFSGSNIQVNNCAWGFSRMFIDTTYWVGGVIAMNTVSEGFKPSGAGWGIRSNTAIALEPYYFAAAGARAVDVRGGFDFADDNTYYIGGAAANRRPFRVASGTGGVLVDPLSDKGFSFATPTNAGDFKFTWWRNNVASMTSTGALIMPKGTTAQRTTAADAGALRWNTDSSKLEVANGSAWDVLGIGGSGGGVADPMRLSTDQTATGKKSFNANLSASVGSAIGFEYSPILTATANNDVLHGGYSSITFNRGAFTNVVTRAHEWRGSVSAGDFNLRVFNTSATAGSKSSLTLTSQSEVVIYNSDGSVVTGGVDLSIQPSSGKGIRFSPASVQKGYWNATGLRVGDGTAATVGLEVATTDAMLAPKGTTAQRPSSPVAGYIRYNTDSAKYEVYMGSAWKCLAFTDQLGSGGGGTSSESFIEPSDANYTIASGTGNIAVNYYDALTADRTVTLPDPTTNTGRRFVIRNGSVSYNLNLSASIYENSTTSYNVIAPGQSITFYSNGTLFKRIQ